MKAEAASVLPSLATEIRQGDNDRYLCSLFAPAQSRPMLWALYAFNLELARVSEKVSEPMLGLIRLAWWREAIEEIYASPTPRRHEVVNALHGFLPAFPAVKSMLLAMIDAREEDLNLKPFPDLESLELYAGKTAGMLSAAVLEVMGPEGTMVKEAVLQASLAYALCGALRNTRSRMNLKAGRQLYIPASILSQCALTEEDWLLRRYPERSVEAACLIASRAAWHCSRVENLILEIPPDERHTAASLLLLSSISRFYLRNIKNSRYEIFQADLERHRIWLPFRLILSSLALKAKS